MRVPLTPHCSIHASPTHTSLLNTYESHSHPTHQDSTCICLCMTALQAVTPKVTSKHCIRKRSAGRRRLLLVPEKKNEEDKREEEDGILIQGSCQPAASSHQTEVLHVQLRKLAETQYAHFVSCQRFSNMNRRQQKATKPDACPSSDLPCQSLLSASRCMCCCTVATAAAAAVATAMSSLPAVSSAAVTDTPACASRGERCSSWRA